MFTLIFSYGFRPLFLCATLIALIFVPWWIAIFLGAATYYGPIDPISWHGHEMIFGFAGAAIGGFLLTAVPNWTSRPPISGLPLGIIVTSWLLARIVFSIDVGLNATGLAAIDTLYWIALTGFIGREIVTTRNHRNLNVLAILAAFLGLTVLFHADAIFASDFDSQRLTLRAAIILTAVLITLIGGRIVPAFTGNWLRATQRGDLLPAPFGPIDRAVFATTIPLGFLWALAPLHTTTGWLALVAGTLQLIRLSRWAGHRTISEPLLFALHVGYAWLGIGFLLIGLAALTPAIGLTGGLHALGAGAMATMIMAVASRAAMGHTGRTLIAGKLLSASFITIHAAALLRVAASMDMRLISVSAALWTLAFLLFAAHVLPILFSGQR